MLLPLEALGLLLLSALLALPVTGALARAQWPARSPRAALVLWQAVGLAGGLSLLTAGLTLAAGAAGRHWWPGLWKLAASWPHLGAWAWAGVVLTCCIGLWLVGVAATSTLRVLRARRVHRDRLAMIAEAGRVDAGGAGRSVLLVEHPVAAAYCLPGVRPQVVVTRGALTSLTSGELTAVLAHERAHAAGHHHLVTQPFIAWARTFWFLPQAREGLAAVDLLVEMLADQLALRQCARRDLAAALRRMGGTTLSAGEAVAADLSQRTDSRLARLEGATRPLSAAVTATIYVAAFVLVVAPPVLLAMS